MAVVSVTTDLANIHLATAADLASFGESANTGYDDFPAPDDEPNFFIQGTQCISVAYANKNSVAGSLFYDNTTSITVPTDGAILTWQFWIAPTSLDTFANLGMFMGVGPDLNNHTFFAVSGSDYPPNPIGGWYCYALDPDNLPATVANVVIGTGKGTNGTDYIQIGGGITSPELARGQAFAIDATRVGRASSIVTAGGGGDPDANFSVIAETLDTVSSRYGIFQASGGSFTMQGRLALGDGTTEVNFTDANQTITILPTPSVGPNFNLIEIQNGTTNPSKVIWDNIFISNPGVLDTVAPSASRGDFILTDNANIQFTGCSFTNMGTFVFNAGTNPNNLEDVTFRNCEQVTQSNAVITGSTFETTVSSTALLANDLSNVSESFFVWNSSGIDNHAIELPSTLVNRTITLTGVDFTSYPSAGGGTANAMIYNNSGAGLVTINAVGCTVDGTTGTITVRNGTSATTTVNQVVSNTVTVTDVDGVAISAAQVAAYLVSDDSLVFNGQTNGSGVATFTSTPSASMYVRVRKSTSGSTRYVPVETPASATATAGINLSVTLVEDLIASA